MFISSELLLFELTKQIEIHLIDTKAHWLRFHFGKIYQKSFQNDQYQKLQEWCNDILVKYSKTIFESEDFTSLQENALISLLKRDDLQMEEIKVWNYIIKWGIAQNPGLSTDPNNWTRENFQSLKDKLQNCLPHIRYFQISGDNIVDNIELYQEILEKDLLKDILKRIANSNRNVQSKILPPRINFPQSLPSSLFFLKNGTIHSSILSRVKKPKYAIYCGPTVGPVFDNDLCMRNNFNQDKQCYCGQVSYEKAIRNVPGWFSISEYEIFEVQEK
ncbi:hypothetical protein C2G38_2318678 [Gigaspora rosea]|uniref:BACK domain-containing protein n=1 Tax=Gigaspora rosea TaxID=44941 RepID=A0A397V2U7_9GLOM|nr:hypothetical protein C2G38_2318678 [Gigaspora rosea]